jgi:murein DD-endopeptidase MepM/ murein hydrolase activator NlpD
MRRSWSKFLVIAATSFVALIAAAPASAGPPWALIHPTTGDVGGTIGVCRGDGCSRLHEGIDIHNARNTDIYASYRGTARVREQPYGVGCGLYIDVIHANGYFSRYCHLERALVADGQAVRKGQHIGEMGDSGNAITTPVHLHYEVKNSGCSTTTPRGTQPGVCNINPAFPTGTRVNARTDMPIDFFLAPSDVAPFTHEWSFIATQHTDFFGRGVTPGELTLWVEGVPAWGVTGLWNGQGGSDVINRLLQSDEAKAELHGVMRLYYTAFDRHPDGGARSWLNKSLSTVATGLLNSNEGKSKLPNNPEAYVRKLYTNGLNRNASASEVSYWAGQVRTRGRAWVMVAISESAEHKGIRRGLDVVQAAYVAMLHRGADSGARDYWVPLLRQNAAASWYLVETIRKSAEYARRF